MAARGIVWTQAAVEAYNRKRGGASLERISRPAARSSLESKFEDMWAVLENPPPYLKELEGIDGRRFRFDYAWVHPKTGKTLLIVELEGTTRQGGRHQRIDGFESDAEKYFIATVVHGWTVVRLTKKLITPERLVLIRDTIRRMQS